MNFDDLKDPEVQERMKSAKTPADLLAIAKESGYELSEEELNAMSGGWRPVCDYDPFCPDW